MSASINLVAASITDTMMRCEAGEIMILAVPFLSSNTVAPFVRLIHQSTHHQ